MYACFRLNYVASTYKGRYPSKRISKFSAREIKRPLHEKAGDVQPGDLIVTLQYLNVLIKKSNFLHKQIVIEQRGMALN